MVYDVSPAATTKKASKHINPSTPIICCVKSSTAVGKNEMNRALGHLCAHIG